MTPGALCLALGVLIVACASSEPPPGRPGEAAPMDEPRSVAPTGPSLRVTCGELRTEPPGPWEDEGERVEGIRNEWHPRAEYGRVTAVREADPPWPFAGHSFVQARVEHGPRPIEPCYLRDEPSDDGPWGPHECVPAWALMEATPAEKRPATAEQWGRLLGTLDGASAVFGSEDDLERCVADLPPHVRAAVPPLGVRQEGDETLVTFVERIEADEDVAMLIAVRATLIDGRLDIERDELWTVEQRRAR